MPSHSLHRRSPERQLSQNNAAKITKSLGTCQRKISSVFGGLVLWSPCRDSQMVGSLTPQGA
jgi:hypothetical protein